jgi:hypothetical protein
VLYFEEAEFLKWDAAIEISLAVEHTFTFSILEFQAATAVNFQITTLIKPRIAVQF